MTADFLCDRFVLIRDKLVERNELDNPDIDAYDLKRYGRTLLRKRLKFSRDIAERVINHKQPESVYDLDDYEDEIREAQEAWITELCRIVGEAT